MVLKISLSTGAETVPAAVEPTPQDIAETTEALDTSVTSQESLSSCMAAPPTPLSSPPLHHHSFVTNYQSGLLSDITEVDTSGEVNVDDGSALSPTLNGCDGKQLPSFSSFGSSYPSTPQVAAPTAVLVDDPEEPTAQQDSTPSHTIVSPEVHEGCDVQDVLAPPKPEAPDSTIANEDVHTSHMVDEQAIQHISTIPTLATYADATNVSV